MNKYEKALNDLKNSEIKLYVYTNQDEIDEKNQPTILDFYHHELFVLQELVEKDKPKKVNNIRRTHKILHEYSGRCPSCRDFLSSVWNKDYCRSCGQKLDWSKEDE